MEKLIAIYTQMQWQFDLITVKSKYFLFWFLNFIYHILFSFEIRKKQKNFHTKEE